MPIRNEEDFLSFLFFLFFLLAIYAAEAINGSCRPRLIASVLECDATSCLVLLPDGTKGLTKRPVKPGDVVEVCQ